MIRRRAQTTSIAFVALLPVVTAVLLVRPVPAGGSEQAVGLYALTFGGASTVTAGEVGAGGGLAVIDSGAPVVRGRLDSSPSGAVRAAPVEPGTLVRTIIGLMNNEAGGETVPVPTADADFPGERTSSEVEGTGTHELGPFTTTGYHAVATAEERRVAGAAETSRQTFTDGAAAANAAALATGLRDLARTFPTAGIRVSGDTSTYRTDGGTVEAVATADAGAGTLTSTVTSIAGRTTVLGQLVVESVVSTATVRLDGGTRTAEAGTTIGGITLGGVPVQIGDDGVVAGDTALLPGQTAAELTAALNEVLEAAGVRLTAIAPREETGDGFAEADAGGVRITVATAPNPQVPGNHLTLVLGRADATLADEPPPASLDVAPIADSSTFAPAQGGFDGGGSTFPAAGSVGGFDSGSVPAAGTDVPGGGPEAPAVAAPAGPEGDGTVLVAGRPISARTALAAFGGWQLLSLSICTLAAFSLRRPSLEAAA